MRSCEVDTVAAPAVPLDSDYVVLRLEQAGATLLALPGGGCSPRLAQGGLDVVRSAMEAYGWTQAPVRPAAPSPHAISEMDEALGWLTLIPQDRYVLRRIVALRMLVHPVTDRHLFPWRRIGQSIGCDHKAVQRWHGNGIALILFELQRRNNFS